MSTSFLLKISAFTFLSIAMLFPTISSAQSIDQKAISDKIYSAQENKQNNQYIKNSEYIIILTRDTVTDTYSITSDKIGPIEHTRNNKLGDNNEIFFSELARINTLEGEHARGQIISKFERMLIDGITYTRRIDLLQEKEGDIAFKNSSIKFLGEEFPGEIYSIIVRLTDLKITNYVESRNGIDYYSLEATNNYTGSSIQNNDTTILYSKGLLGVDTISGELREYTV